MRFQLLYYNVFIFQLMHGEVQTFSIGSPASKQGKSAKHTANTHSLGEMTHTGPYIMAQTTPVLLVFSIALTKNRVAYGFLLLKHMKHRTWKCALLKTLFLYAQTRWCTS